METAVGSDSRESAESTESTKSTESKEIKEGTYRPSGSGRS